MARVSNHARKLEQSFVQNHVQHALTRTVHIWNASCLKKRKEKREKRKGKGGRGVGRKKHAGTSSVELDDVSRIEPFCIRMHRPPVYTCLAPHHYYAHKLQSSLFLSAVLRTITTELTFSSLHIPDDLGYDGHIKQHGLTAHIRVYAKCFRRMCRGRKEAV